MRPAASGDGHEIGELGEGDSKSTKEHEKRAVS